MWIFPTKNSARTSVLVLSLVAKKDENWERLGPRANIPAEGETMRKAIVFGALVALFAPTLHAQRQETGLIIQSCKYNPETKELALNLVNLSGKDIIAYNISDSDGSTDLLGRPNLPGEHLEDSLGVLINAQMMGKEPPKDPPNGIIAAGGTRTRILGAKDSSVKAVIDLGLHRWDCGGPKPTCLLADRGHTETLFDGDAESHQGR